MENTLKQVDCMVVTSDIGNSPSQIIGADRTKTGRKPPDADSRGV